MVARRHGQLTLSWDNSSSWLWGRTISYTVQLEYKVEPLFPQILDHPDSESEGMSEISGDDFHVTGDDDLHTELVEIVDHQTAAPEPPRPSFVPPTWVYVVRDDGTSYYMDPHNMSQTVEVVNSQDTGEMDFKSGGQGGGPLSPMTPLPARHSEHKHANRHESKTQRDKRQDVAITKLQARARGRATRSRLAPQQHRSGRDPTSLGSSQQLEAIRRVQARARGRAARAELRRRRTEVEDTLRMLRETPVAVDDQNDGKTLGIQAEQSTKHPSDTSTSTPQQESAVNPEPHADPDPDPKLDSEPQSSTAGEPSIDTRPSAYVWGGVTSFRQAAKSVKMQSRGTNLSQASLLADKEHDDANSVTMVDETHSASTNEAHSTSPGNPIHLQSPEAVLRGVFDWSNQSSKCCPQRNLPFIRLYPLP